jgi:hypothetical protein
MANTYEAIATVTVGSGGASSIDFTSIPGTYTDLMVYFSGRVESSSPYYGRFYFNNNTTGYTRRALGGDGSSTFSTAFSNEYTLVSNEGTYTANTFSNFSTYIPNYAGSTNKSYSVDGVTENNATSSYQIFYAGLWSNTAAINQITLVPDTLKFVQYTTATIYGIKNS